MTNTYDLKKLEIIIVDNGSTDSSVIDFIRSYTPDCKYRFILNEKNDYPYCLRYSKVQAIEVAEGDYFIDLPDDHIFVAQTGWIDECIKRIKKDQSVGCINYYAYPGYRFGKSNNKMHPDKSSPNFCVSVLKGYSDFHIMSKHAYEKIGPYRYDLGSGAEGEYMDRALERGFFRNLMMFPVAICMNQGKFGEGEFGFELVRPIEKEKYDSDLIGFMRKRHPEKVSFPIHNEALIEFCLKEGYIRVKDE
jgi:glycosyltransferase involved in cell wall biosynthesis